MSTCLVEFSGSGEHLFSTAEYLKVCRLSSNTLLTSAGMANKNLSLVMMDDLNLVK